MGSGSGRRTPYELVFGQSGIEEQEFPAIIAEAEASGVADSRRDQFARMSSVGSLLGRLLPEDVDPASLDDYLDILFHCYHFWQAGRPLYVIEPELVRSLIESRPDLRDWSPEGDRRTAYFQFPRNQFWAAVTEGQPPEPADGMFVRVGNGESTEVRLLTVLGMRPGRAGFSVATLVTDVERAREIDEPGAFRSDIPGADLAGIYSLQRSSEAATLGLRLLWYLGSYPEAIEKVRGQHDASEDLDYESPTTLDHYRVRLVKRPRG